MPRRKSQEASSAEMCVNLENVERFLNFVYFYKANAVSILVSGRELADADVGSLAELFNSYVSGLKVKGGKSRREGECGDWQSLDPKDFEVCGKRLSSDELVEMKEYLKWSSRPYKLKTSEVFKTSCGIAKLAEAADRIMRVRIGDVNYVMVIEVPPEKIHERMRMAEVNRRFFEMARGDLGFTELFVLANALLAQTLGGNCNVPARLVLIRDPYYTSLPLSASSLCREREFAQFYLDLVRARSGYTSYVASALLRYLQTGDVGELYAVVRNMTQSRRLTSAERDAVSRLVARI